MPKYGAGARVRGARERGGPQPRAERTLERDEARSRGGGVSPRAGRDHSRGVSPLERGGTRPRGSAPSSEAGPARGDF
jgi:hypothetical protein